MNDQISRQNLKPCPFCGGKASTTKRERWKDESCTYSRPDYGVSCQECYAKGYQYYSTVEEAIEAWNKRVEPPADQWIPCSERLPKDCQTVPVTVILWEEKRILSHATYHTEKPAYWHPYDWDGEGFYIYDSELGECKYKDVVAWLNVEPYKGE